MGAKKLALLQFDDESDPSELIVKLQGMDKVWAFKSKIIVPISHIESIRVAGPGEIKADRLVKVVGAGIGGFKVGDFLESNGKEKNRLLFLDVHHKQAAADGKVILIVLKDERYEELVLEVDDVGSEKVMKVLLGQLDGASPSL